MSREGFPGGCNPADVLYKLAHSKGIKPPIFEMISEQGPPHARTFTWSCSFFEGKYHTMAAGRSKKEAKNAVAKALIDQIDINDLPQKKKSAPSMFAQKMKGGKRKMNEMDDAGDVVAKENGAAVGANGTPGMKKTPNNKRKQARMGQVAEFNSDSMMMPFMMGFGGPVMPPNPFMAAQMAMGIPLMPPMGGPNIPPMGMQPRMPMRTPRRLNKDDYMVINKHKDIYPTKEELSLLLQLTDIAEKSLKRVSDKFCNKVEAEVTEDEKTETTKNEKEREIMGVARVGDISKGLLLTGDRSVNLVVMCKNKPTIQLLDSISSEVEKDLKENPTSIDQESGVKIEKPELEVHTFQQEGGFCVVLNKEGSEEPYAVNVNLACTKMREKNVDKQEDKKDKSDQQDESMEDKTQNGTIKKEDIKTEDTEEDPVDMLPKDKCIRSLADLRRAKWFTSMAAPLESCTESIRIFKELSKRIPEWMPVGDWAIELLVERALSSGCGIISPCKAVLRVLEVVASGIVSPDGAGIKDPCERETQDVFAHLTGQQKEDLTRSAQEMVRMVHFRQIYKILDMEKPLSYQQRKAAKDKLKEEAKLTAEVKAEKEDDAAAATTA